MASFNKQPAVSVCMFLPGLQPLPMGGAEKQAVILAESLITKGVTVFFLAPGRTGIPPGETQNGIPVTRFLTITERLKNFLKIKESPSEFEPEVIFDYSSFKKENLLYRNDRISIKRIWIMFDYFISIVPKLYKQRRTYEIIQINTVTWMSVVIVICGRLLSKKVLVKDSTMNGVSKMYQTPFPSFFRKFIARHASFVAMTDVIERNLLKAGISAERIYKIPNGIKAISVPRRSMVNKIPQCLFVGNLYQQPAKGFDVLLLAWPLVLRSLPGTHLHVVGAGNVSAYVKYVAEQGMGEFISFYGKNNPDRFYKSCDLFILPSRREGMANVLLEAMMYGMPIVATNISGSMDLIEPGRNGYLVPTNEAVALAENIIKALTNPDLQKSSALVNSQKIKERFSIEIVADKYIEAYKEMRNVYN